MFIKGMYFSGSICFNKILNLFQSNTIFQPYRNDSDNGRPVNQLIDPDLESHQFPPKYQGFSKYNYFSKHLIDAPP